MSLVGDGVGRAHIVFPTNHLIGKSGCLGMQIRADKHVDQYRDKVFHVIITCVARKVSVGRRIFFMDIGIIFVSWERGDYPIKSKRFLKQV